MTNEESLLVGALITSVIPIFNDPFHPEKYGGEARRVIFWEWLYKELWELYTGIELRLRRD